MSEELKPCPFCGGRAHGANGFFACGSDADVCHFSGFKIEPDHWNSAWAHKRIAELEQRNAELRELNLKAKDVLEKTLDCEASASVARNRLEIKLSELEQMADKLARALEKIRDRKEYSCECVGEECSCDFSFMQFIAEQALAAYKVFKGEK